MSKFSHWSSALLVIILLIIGNYMVGLGEEDIRYYRSLDLHQTLGLAVWSLLWFGLLWRFISPPPPLDPMRENIKRVRFFVHTILKLALFIQPILGYLFATAWGDPIEIYGLFEIPAITALSKASSELIINLHAYLAYSLAALISLHGLVALKHHYIEGDAVLKRLL